MLNCGLGAEGPSARESRERGDGGSWVGLDSKATSQPVVSGSSLQKHRDPGCHGCTSTQQFPTLLTRNSMMPHNLLRMRAVRIASADISSGYSDLAVRKAWWGFGNRFKVQPGKR